MNTVFVYMNANAGKTKNVALSSFRDPDDGYRSEGSAGLEAGDT